MVPPLFYFQEGLIFFHYVSLFRLLINKRTDTLMVLPGYLVELHAHAGLTVSSLPALSFPDDLSDRVYRLAIIRKGEGDFHFRPRLEWFVSDEEYSASTDVPGYIKGHPLLVGALIIYIYAGHSTDCPAPFGHYPLPEKPLFTFMPLFLEHFALFVPAHLFAALLDNASHGHSF